MNDMIRYESTNSIYDDICNIIEDSQQVAFRSVNVVLVLRNWLLGKRIAEEELKGEGRAEYGMKLVENLSKSLSENYGNGFTKRSLYKYLQFYKYFPQIVPSVTAQTSNDLIVPSVTAQLLSWTHYEKLLQVQETDAREWYAKEAYEQAWSVRTLQRNISSQYYFRMLKTQDESIVENEMKEITLRSNNRLILYCKYITMEVEL